MSALLISRETVTADNYGPAVSVVTWILVVSAVLGVLLKVGLGLGARVAMGSDDATLIFSTVKKPHIYFTSPTKSHQHPPPKKKSNLFSNY